MLLLAIFGSTSICFFFIASIRSIQPGRPTSATNVQATAEVSMQVSR